MFHLIWTTIFKLKDFDIYLKHPFIFVIIAKLTNILKSNFGFFKTEFQVLLMNSFIDILAQFDFNKI